MAARGEVLTGGVWDAFLALPARTAAERCDSRGTPPGRPPAHSGSITRRRRSTASSSTRPSAASAVATWARGQSTLDRARRGRRPFLRRTDNRYDLIIVDAYHQPYVPFYLATREFFRLVRERLASGGIVALNVAAVPDDERLVRAIGRTLGAEPPAGAEWPALRFNTIVAGLTEPIAS